MQVRLASASSAARSSDRLRKMSLCAATWCTMLPADHSTSALMNYDRSASARLKRGPVPAGGCPSPPCCVCTCRKAAAGRWSD